MNHPGNILYIQYANPAAYPPLEHSARILADRGWDVLILGLRSLSVRCASHPRVTVRLMPACSPGAAQKLHYIGFCLWTLLWAIRWRPTYVYASDLFSCPAALLISRVSMCRIIYHEHDAPIVSQNSVSRFLMRTRRKLANRALLCVVPNHLRAERFAIETQLRTSPAVVWNCPARQETGAPRLQSTSELRLLYHGSIVPSRLPVSVVEALALLPDTVRLRVVGYETIGSVGYVAALERRAAELGVSHRFEYVGLIPDRSGLLALCRTCDIGLALVPFETDDINMLGMCGASNKPFDYLACGLSLLVTNRPDWLQMFVAPGYGLACDPSAPGNIAEAVRRFLDDPARMREMGEAGRRRILADWNYETQFRPVCQLISTPGTAARIHCTSATS